MGGHERVHSHVYACVGPDRGWHELDSGSAHHSFGKSDCFGTHAAECACRHALWHSVSCLCTCFIWCTRCECACNFAGSRSLRLVWHPSVDWRASNLLDVAHRVAWRSKSPWQQLDLLLS